MRIANNISAFNAFNALNSTNQSLSKVINTLSTGLRINSAADDAAGFAISEKLRSQIGGLDVALRNSQDGISLLQTAEGALEQTNSMLQRMRDLSVQASNDSLTSTDRQYIQLEIDQLRDEIDRIAGTTQFNKKRILDGSSGALWASSDPGVKVRVNGGLTHTDNFGQKVSTEGNYRIEITASPGEAQVQKNNIYNLATYKFETRTEIEYETVTETVTEEITEISTEIIYEDKTIPYSIYINEGFDSLKASSGSGWNFHDGVLTITSGGKYNIIGTGNPTTNRIVVASGVNATVFLENVNIDVGDMEETCAVDFAGASVDLYLKGTNDLCSGTGYAGINVPGLPVNSELTISSMLGDGSSYGTLTSKGGLHAAGIGGRGFSTNYSDEGGRAGSIIINGGTIYAVGGDLGSAGIGGGNTNGPDGGGKITINGGLITAYGGGGSAGGAGIGSGYYASGVFGVTTDDNTQIKITGGIIKAYGGVAYSSAGAGIGGGGYSNSGQIRIRDGLQSSIIAVPGNIRYIEAEAIGYGQGVLSADYGGEPLAHDVQWINFPDFVPRDIPSVPTVDVKAPKEVIKETTREITHEVTRIIGVITKEVSTENIYYKKLSEISQFYNSNGVFLVSQPQTITITQGDGKTAGVTLYENDTIQDVARKINDVIAYTFGNAKHTDNPAKFCTVSDGTEGTSESIYESEPIYDNDGNTIGHNIHATMLVRSGIPGKDGELYFSGDEDILNALGLNTIQESSESSFTASVYDAHSGAVITSGAKLTGNVIQNALTGVDIEFGNMAGIKSTWDENTKRYIFTGGEKYTATLHLKDNGITFQTGANKGEDFSIQLGDMSCSALGINGVNAATRESASRSIGIIDRAISKVSSQRAKIGASLNGLEHTMSSLTTTTANLTAADSRLRDADMALTMMDFVRLQILNQSGTSMLAQANQLPQSVLSLLQG